MNDTLDPADWQSFRHQGQQMLDDMFDYLEYIRERPVWQPVPKSSRNMFQEPMPRQGTGISDIHEIFMQHILPNTVGNAHPGFMGWVHGGGTVVGMLAEMLAAGLNANVGGRDQIPVEVEWQVLRWMRELFKFPISSSGLFVDGTSMATVISLLVARTSVLGEGVRRQGIQGKCLVAYASAGAHSCIARAMDMVGIGTEALRLIPTDKLYQIDLKALNQAIAEDRERGYIPFFVAGNAGTVDTGAIDDLASLARIARRESLWFHVDGAYGALAMMAHDIAPKLAGIEKADAIAFDFHKWGQVPYDAGFVLIRDEEKHRKTFAQQATYLRREERGLAGGSPWPCDYGPSLSRGFRALKAWFTIKAYGTARLGSVISRTCELARYMKERIEESDKLELLAPVTLNIVCYGYRCSDADRTNADIAVALQESGIAAPSTTIIDGRLAIRAAIFNHRTREEDIDELLEATLKFGLQRECGK